MKQIKENYKTFLLYKINGGFPVVMSNHSLERINEREINIKDIIEIIKIIKIDLTKSYNNQKIILSNKLYDLSILIDIQQSRINIITAINKFSMIPSDRQTKRIIIDFKEVVINE